MSPPRPPRSHSIFRATTFATVSLLPLLPLLTLLPCIESVSAHAETPTATQDKAQKLLEDNAMLAKLVMNSARITQIDPNEPTKEQLDKSAAVR